MEIILAPFVSSLSVIIIITRMNALQKRSWQYPLLPKALIDHIFVIPLGTNHFVCLMRPRLVWNLHTSPIYTSIISLGSLNSSISANLLEWITLHLTKLKLWEKQYLIKLDQQKDHWLGNHPHFRLGFLEVDTQTRMWRQGDYLKMILRPI